LQEIVEEIGAVAGSAAGVGLALLFALHFSQARDIRRLRERAGRAPAPSYRTRYGAIALVGLLVLGVAAASQLIGDDGGDKSAQANNGVRDTPKRNVTAIKPGTVTVAVLNGTTVPGLAAALRDQIAGAGFKPGTINNFSDQQLAESVVQYSPGRQAEAKAVGRTLGIGRREPVTADSLALAGNATVIVIAGADKAP
jgi:hypothetical protein